MNEQLIEEIHLLHDRMCLALQDPKRIMILYALAERPRYVNELAALLDQPQSTISRHLQVLRDRALVKTERQGQTVYYSLGDERIIEALDLMRSMLRDAIRARANLLEGADS
jgi:ArsR family transcriptional regulator